MSEFRRESHLRSVLKGISWRIVATFDTFAVVVLVLWFHNGAGDFDLAEASQHAFKIGMYEFFIKLAVYYVHERVWEQLRHGDGCDKARTLKKSISWRIIATTMTFVIAAIILKKFDHVALTIAGIEFFTKFALYYVHERAWLKLPLGRVRRWFSREKPNQA